MGTEEEYVKASGTTDEVVVVVMGMGTEEEYVKA